MDDAVFGNVGDDDGSDDDGMLVGWEEGQLVGLEEGAVVGFDV